MEDIKKYAEKEHIPTVNEGIEEPKMVVRCKDCKYWITKGWLTEDTNIKVCNRLECLEGCDSTCWDMEADDFCSKGERKDE